MLWATGIAHSFRPIPDDPPDASRQAAALAQALERGGADCVLIACNTQHVAADQAADKIGIPLLHIADATGAAVAAAGLHRVALLGTRFTMERDFFTGRLRDRYGIETLLPEPDERDVLHRTIFEEFAKGKYTDETRRWYVDLVGRLLDRGAEGVVLGCTEISLLLGPDDLPGVQLFDTTTLHALAAVDFGLGESPEPDPAQRG
jgi:aspartate racemase